MQYLALVAIATVLLTLSETSKGQLLEDESAITTLGCFEDAHHRDLPIVHHAGSLTTKNYCWRYCHSNGYKYFGMQSGDYCMCGNTYGKYGRVELDQCSGTACHGDRSTPCGNNWRNVIFTTGLDRSNAQIKEIGCFVESQASKDLPLQHAADRNRASKHYCWAYCHSRGFVYFGIRSGEWCACGNSYGRYGPAASRECQTPCPIASEGFCGGLNRNLIFTTGLREANKTRLGCYAACNNRLPELPLIHESPAGMNSAQYCGHYCVSHGYRYFGLLPGNRCSCGAAVNMTYGRVSDTECHQVCGPATNDTCGAPDRIEAYDSGALNLASQAVYIGCYTDSSSARDLSALEHYMGSEATKYNCWRMCHDRGFRYFGLQNGDWCFCGNSFGRHARVTRDQCSTKCEGDATATCGRQWHNEVYATGFEDSSTVPTIACFSDSFMEPDLPLVMPIPGGEGLNATQYCLHLCRSKGYRYFAVRPVAACSCGSLLKYKNLSRISNSTANCGPDPANHVFATGVEDWERGVIHLGCFVDEADRDLPIFHNAEGLATKYYCWKYCHSRGYRYFGLQSQSYCMCGNSYGKHEQLPDSECRQLRCQGDESAWCAAAMRNIIFTTGAEPWDKSVTRIGCFEHNATKRNLPLTHNAGTETRHQFCWHFCHSRGYRYFAVQSGVYCSCGNAIGSEGKVNDTECNTRCMGDPGSTCGAEFRNEIFTTGVDEWENRVTRVGCYSDRNHDRDLRVFHRLGHATSKYACWKYCKAARNWRYFGLQNGEYCACGDSYGRHGRLGDSACDVTCRGDKSSTCGGNEKNELFSTGLDNWESTVSRLGCFADQSGTDQRDLPFEHRAGSQASKHACWLYCRSRGYMYFSLQAREFCYCGNSYGRYGRVANVECNLKCLGEEYQTCGGDLRNEVFTTGLETWEQGITRLGCFHDNPTSPDLPLKYDAGNWLTKKFCWNYCRQRGYKLFGLQDSRLCLCGNSHGRHGRSDEAACHERCRGDYSTTCGAGSRTEIYTTGIADWENGTLHIGCFADNSVNPDMPLANSMLPESASKYTCWQLCSSRGYAYFGLQGGSLCFCGNTYGRHGLADASDCKSTCSGDNTNHCGGHLKSLVFKTGLNYNSEISASRIGCFVDSLADDRDLPLMHQAVGILATRHYCRAYCRSKGYRYFGLQAGQWCTCGNAYGRHGKAADSKECGVRCQGDVGVTCGGRMRNEVFRT